MGVRNVDGGGSEGGVEFDWHCERQRMGLGLKTGMEGNDRTTGAL